MYLGNGRIVFLRSGDGNAHNEFSSLRMFMEVHNRWLVKNLMVYSTYFYVYILSALSFSSLMRMVVYANDWLITNFQLYIR